MRMLWDYWNHQRNVISLKISKTFKDAVSTMPSKRNILIAIARADHPVGYLQPLVIMLKCISKKHTSYI